MATSFEQTLIDVWRQVLVEDVSVVLLGRKHYPVHQTSKRRLREVDFVFEGKMIRGLEQNPETKSRWAEMARAGDKVMQFLSDGRYLANMVGGKLTMYDRGDLADVEDVYRDLRTHYRDLVRCVFADVGSHVCSCHCHPRIGNNRLT